MVDEETDALRFRDPGNTEVLAHLPEHHIRLARPVVRQHEVRRCEDFLPDADLRRTGCSGQNLFRNGLAQL